MIRSARARALVLPSIATARAEAAECAADHADGSPTIAEMTPPCVRANERPASSNLDGQFLHLDLCAISLPLPRQGGLPTGLMLFARNGHDRQLFRIAAAIERLFAG